MNLDLSLDLTPGSKVSISPTRRSPLLLPPEAVSHGSPAHFPALERLSKDASTLSEDLDELRSRIKRADVCRLYPDVPRESQLMISPTANPALSAIASSVLNDKVQSVRNDLASETQARLSGDDDNSRRLLRLEQKYNELDIRLRVVELERASKKEGDALKMAREEIAKAQKDAIDDLTSKLKEEIEEVKKDLEQKMIKDSTCREEIQKVKKETENALKHMFEEEIKKVRKELKSHPGQSDKLDKIKEEIKVYDKVCDEDDFHFLQAHRQEAKLLSQRGQYKEAEKAWEKVWKECQQKFGEEDRMTIEAQHEFATILQLQEKFDDAERQQKDVLDKAKTYLKEDHPVTLAAMKARALTLWHLRRLPEAQALYKEVEPLYRDAQEDKMAEDVKQKIEEIQNQKIPGEIQRVSGGSSGSERPKHVMLSGRFNNKKNIEYMNKVKELLDERGIPTYMVSSQTGERFSGPTMFGLYHAKAMVIFGTDDYGAKTGAGYETFYELQYAWENELDLIAIQLSNTWPPKPDNDKEDAGKIQNKYVLNSALLREIDEEMEKPDEMAEKIAESVRKFDEANGKSEGSKDNKTISQQDPLELKNLETRLKQASESLVVEKLEAVKSNLKEVLREALDSDMKEKFEAFTTKASKESEDNKRKMDEKSGELDKVVNGFTSDFKDFKAKLETKADSTRLNQEINQVQTEIQRERGKLEALESETRDHKAKLAPMESRINEVEFAEKQTKELVQRNAREMEAERQQAREETKREARELEANIQDDMKKRVKGLEEKLQSTLDGKAELVKLQQLQSDLLSRSEEKEKKLEQELQREIRKCSEESQDKTEKVKKEMKDQVGQMESRVESLMSLIRIIKGSAAQIAAA